jgi:hypothetical protein
MAHGLLINVVKFLDLGNFFLVLLVLKKIHPLYCWSYHVHHVPWCLEAPSAADTFEPGKSIRLSPENQLGLAESNGGRTDIFSWRDELRVTLPQEAGHPFQKEGP